VKSLRLFYTALALALPALGQAGGEALVQGQCASCHALEAPAESADIGERTERQAPPLYYAGNKYREQWLVEWLQQPRRLHPAGYYPPEHVQAGEGGDQVQADTLVDHPALSAEEAGQAAEYLMTLRDHDELIEQDSYEPGSVALRMGMMDFRKFKGCDACHRDAEDNGGLSGPELYTAWQRLQPAYISSYIANPVAWDRHSMMPAQDYNETAVHKLVHYLKAIGEE